MKQSTILLAIYNHPDKFPPTLNAIKVLSQQFDRLLIIYRDETNLPLEVPKNCIIHKIESPNLITNSSFKKLKILIHFIIASIKLYKKYRPDCLLCYDQYSFFSCNIIKKTYKNVKLWYHNHDVTDLTYIKKLSMSWFLWKNEQFYIKNADLFTLPDRNRLFSFKVNVDQQTFIEIPNYPSINYNNTPVYKTTKTLKILYQGRVSEGHGIIELIDFIANTPNKNIEFHIIGSYEREFTEKLHREINQKLMCNKVFLHERLALYSQLKDFSKNFHIGLGIMEPLNIQYQNCAKASNKIYEYVALGMPVILMDNPSFRTSLQNFEWAFFSDLSNKSFETILAQMDNNYEKLSSQAFKDYKASLHFEFFFNKALEKLNLTE